MVREYVFNSTLGQFVVPIDPIGWDDIDKTLSRDPNYLGIFRKYTAQLEFVGDETIGYLQSAERSLGSEGVVSITVYRKKDYEDKKEIEFEGVAKLNPFEIEYKTDKGSLTPYITLSFEDSGFHSRFMSRDDQEVNTASTTTIEGVDIGAFDKKTIALKQRDIIEINRFETSENNRYHDGLDGLGDISDSIVSEQGHVVPISQVEGETEDISTPIEYLPSDPDLIHDFSAVPKQISLTGNIDCEGLFTHLRNSLVGNITDPLPTSVRFILRIFTGDKLTFQDTLIHTVNISNVTTETFPFGLTTNTRDTIHISEAFDIDYTFQIEANQGFTIMYFFFPENFDTTYSLQYNEININLDVKSFFEDTAADCHYKHEYLERITQIMTDQEDSFQSTVLGRTDIGYAENGAYSNHVALSGLQIRGFDSPPKTKWRDAFQSVRAQLNVGCGIEKHNNRFKVVIEDITYFFKGTISQTIHNITNISRRTSKDFTFSDIKVGYKKAEYEEVNGLEEYNTKSEYATFIKSAKRTLNLISPERADTFGIEYARRLNKLFAATKDTKYDKDTFNIVVGECVDGTLEPLKEKVATNIVSPGTAYNLDITPRANLERSGDWINAGLLNYPDEFLKFISSDEETDIEVDGVAVQADIKNSDLISPLWYNHVYGFDCILTPSEFDEIEKNPYSLLKVSPFSRERTKMYLYGWVLEVKGGGEGRAGSVKLLRANLSSDRLRIIDPEGVDNGQEGSELPPPPVSSGSGGFPHVFEHVFEQ